MYLKQLQLTGFKSFADMTKMEFSPGLTAVVGPNGSGKSNIADALRWVLGEQSVKQLRGGKMEDVIFAGTAHRRPLGFADITMRLDNTNKKLAPGFDEISVTRRLYRSGESEYMLNGEICRLKDIQMLFMDTGIGKDGYSIVGQGKIDDILSIRSEDRRLVFEEAAGIAGYKARRNDALNKLERERQNILRIDDIITEISSQLPLLEEQSADARQYLLLRDEYRSIHISTIVTEMTKIETESNFVTKTLEDTKAQFEKDEELLNSTKMYGSELKENMAAADLEYKEINAGLVELTGDIEKKQGDLKLYRNEAGTKNAEIIRLGAEIERRVLGASSKKEELDSSVAKLEGVRIELNDLNNQFEAYMAENTKYTEEVKKDNERRNELNNKVMEKLNILTDKRSTLKDKESGYNRLEDEVERINETKENLLLELNEAKAKRITLSNEKEVKDKDLTTEKTKEESCLESYQKIRNELQDIDSNRRAAGENLTAAKGQYRALQSLEAGLDGYYQSVRVILSKRNEPRFAGICGAVSELISTEQKYETAIEIALGSAAQNIVTKTEEDAKEAIEYLKEKRAGRATFLPLTAVKGKKVNNFNDSGFIGIASDLVSFEAEYVNIFNQILGDILIVDNMDNALIIHKKYGYSKKIVTLSGERLSPGGAITGGSTASRTSNLIGRGQKLKNLGLEVEKLENEYNKLNASAEDLLKKREEVREILQGIRVKTEEINGSLVKIDVSIQLADAEHERLQGTLSNLDKSNADLLEEIAQTNREIRGAKDLLTEKERDYTEAIKVHDDFVAECERKRVEHEDEAEELTSLRVDINVRNERVNEMTNGIRRLENEIEVILKEEVLLKRELTIAQTNKKTAEETMDSLRDLLITLDARLEEVKADLLKNEELRISLKKEYEETELKERSAGEAKNLLQQEIVRLEMRAESLLSTGHRLNDELWNEYNLTLVRAAEFKRTDMSETAQRQRVNQLKRELSEMQNINIGAIELFNETKTRYDFLTSQRADIVEAENALLDLVQNLTTQMEEIFRNSLNIINQHFGEIFKEMFEGGNAGIKLLEESNILESGIEIIAQPPGKKLQNLMLLSGGERALTAIALLFAILRMKPSPFCVLDEIESALDDANIARFARFIKEYSKKTQFIIITHRKGTMEAADNLYGVTMEEQGVSKLVSVRLEDEL